MLGTYVTYQLLLFQLQLDLGLESKVEVIRQSCVAETVHNISDQNPYP